MEKEQCKECQKQKKTGHNYCRVCGFHFTKGNMQYGRINVEFTQDEYFCGYCGRLKNKCKCFFG